MFFRCVRREPRDARWILPTRAFVTLLAAVAAGCSAPAPRPPTAHQRLADAERYAAMGDTLRAGALLDQLIAEASDVLPEAHLARARLRLDAGAVEPARIDVELARGRLPQGPTAAPRRAELEARIDSLERDLRRARAVAALAPPAAAAAERPPAPAPRDPDAPPILPRSAWHAAPIRANRDPMSAIRRLTVHHSAISWTATDQGETAAHIRSIQQSHQGGNGWADIGYHYVIDRSGRIWQGRELAYQGAHAGNPDLNSGNVGVVVLGDYQRQDLTPAQGDALARLIGWCQRRYRIPAWSIQTHREVRERGQAGSTACPGRNLASWVEDYRAGAGRPALAAPLTTR